MSAHAVIFDERNRVLLIKQTYGNLAWGLPGGAVDPGETLLDTLRRECREELGVDVVVGPLTGVYYHASLNAHAIVFRCELPAGAAIRLSDEHSAHAFHELSELSPVQRHRVEACLRYTGMVDARAF